MPVLHLLVSTVYKTVMHRNGEIHLLCIYFQHYSLPTSFEKIHCFILSLNAHKTCMVNDLTAPLADKRQPARRNQKIFTALSGEKHYNIGSDAKKHAVALSSAF